MVLMIFFSIHISLASVAVNRTSVPGNTVQYVSQLAVGLPKASKILFNNVSTHLLCWTSKRECMKNGQVMTAVNFMCVCVTPGPIIHQEEN